MPFFIDKITLSDIVHIGLNVGLFDGNLLLRRDSYPCHQKISQIVRVGDLSMVFGLSNSFKIIADWFRITYSYPRGVVHGKPKIEEVTLWPLSRAIRFAQSLDKFFHGS